MILKVLTGAYVPIHYEVQESMMEPEKVKLTKTSEDYFSCSREKMRAISETLDSRMMRIADENNHVAITINGKQALKSIEISNLLLDTTQKGDVIDILVNNINAALQKSGRANLEELMKVISLKEYVEILAHEQAQVQGSISKVGKKINQFTEGLLSVKKKAVSKSGNVEMTMSGANLILSIVIPDAFLSSGNKMQIESDLLETTNELTDQIQQMMTGQLLSGGEELRRDIQID